MKTLIELKNETVGKSEDEQAEHIVNYVKDCLTIVGFDEITDDELNTVLIAYNKEDNTYYCSVSNFDTEEKIFEDKNKLALVEMAYNYIVDVELTENMQ
ncbi:hypothetical protein [Aliarcobacter butzleri]|uniref:hypothetical protein n=1 Tax=Aliarcobacter butzleri TaxID=28197 RepID=UPI0021B4A559|nr:hypothetical protein [Aliarcobacter butzleri]MCT7647631.1 hypothetical protein [Aliarcobacter butzleri]